MISYVVCVKLKRAVVCRPDQRKPPSLFPKWWCFNCHKYVLPDGKYHLTYFWPGEGGVFIGRKEVK